MLQQTKLAHQKGKEKEETYEKEEKDEKKEEKQEEKQEEEKQTTPDDLTPPLASANDFRISVDPIITTIHEIFAGQKGPDDLVKESSRWHVFDGKEPQRNIVYTVTSKDVDLGLKFDRWHCVSSSSILGDETMSLASRGFRGDAAGGERRQTFENHNGALPRGSLTTHNITVTTYNYVPQVVQLRKWLLAEGVEVLPRRRPELMTLYSAKCEQGSTHFRHTQYAHNTHTEESRNTSKIQYDRDPIYYTTTLHTLTPMNVPPLTLIQ